MSLRKSALAATDSDTGEVISCDVEPDWRIPLEPFISRRYGNGKLDKGVPKKIRSYYKAQDELINTFEEMQEHDSVMTSVPDGVSISVRDPEVSRTLWIAGILAKITFIVNLLLLVAKAVAVGLSGSISIISSLLDSAMDLVAGLVIWWTCRAMKKRNRYIYPQGRTKLEPVGIVILAVVMAVSSLQIIKESISRMVAIHLSSKQLPSVDYIVICISACTIVTKLALFLVSRRIINPSAQALAQDHRNDVLTNTTAIAFGYLGSREMQRHVKVMELGHIDPIGAILISVYIIITWGMTAYTQIRMLTGYRAGPHFLSKVTWMCMNHHLKILKVDTVRAFHFGQNFLVEVDIVLPEMMTLKEAHDIAEPLQQKIESLKEVERAFVHVDYEVNHNPNKEHKHV